MGFEKLSNKGEKTRLEMSPDNGLEFEIAKKVLENFKMFQLPNNSPLNFKNLRLRVGVLSKQFNLVLQHEKTRTEIISEIDNLLQADNKDVNWINRIKVIFEKAPQQAADGLMRNIKYLPEGIREEITRLALEKAPQQAADRLMRNIKYLPEGIREEIQIQVMEILQTTERKELIESEEINPTLYKKTKDLEKQFSKEEFSKTGTRTVLLGGTLKNNAILRIIPRHAFISWMKAYSAVEDWKEAGFDYVPIEPILKASLSSDDKNVRVYAGVLGVSVQEYFKMYFNREYHQNVKQQVRAIQDTLKKIGITYASINPAHEHNNNYCILHNRTPEGEIDWSKPP